MSSIDIEKRLKTITRKEKDLARLARKLENEPENKIAIQKAIEKVKFRIGEQKRYLEIELSALKDSKELIVAI